MDSSIKTDDGVRVVTIMIGQNVSDTVSRKEITERLTPEFERLKKADREKIKMEYEQVRGAKKELESLLEELRELNGKGRKKRRGRRKKDEDIEEMIEEPTKVTDAKVALMNAEDRLKELKPAYKSGKYRFVVGVVNGQYGISSSFEIEQE